MSSGAGRFADTPPLSTYNTVVNAGPFHELRRTIDGFDLGLYCRRSLRALLDRDADDLFTVTRAGIGVLRRAFAMPFPQQATTRSSCRTSAVRWRTTAA